MGKEFAQMIDRNSLPRARWLVALLVLVWVLIYLPELGTREVQGNEARRILPARTMLATDHWLVPELAGRLYFTKPPLINWMIAASLRITGRDNEWAGRLPTTLWVLMYGLMLVAVPCRWMDAYCRALAALVFFTSYGIMLAGRYAEIDGALACVSGMAVWWWISQYPETQRPCRLWLPCGVLLGAGLLLKGPLILLFYYSVVLAVLGVKRDLKALLTPAHLLSILLMLALFALWAIPALWAAQGAGVAQIWSSELTAKFRHARSPVAWVRSVLGAALNFMPWLLLVPSALRQSRQGSDESRTFTGLWIGAGVCFVLLSLMPGTRAHYTIPLIGVTCIPLGYYLGHFVLHGGGFEPRSVLSRGPWILCGTLILGFGAQLGIYLCTRSQGTAFPTTPRIGTAVLALGVTLALVLCRQREAGLFRHSWGHPLGVALVLACASLQARTFITPALSLDDHQRPVGRTLREHLDPGQTLYLYLDERDQYKPFLYYLPYRLAYLQPGQGLDPRMRYLFARDRLYTQTAQRLVPHGLQLQTLCQLEYKHDDYFLGRVVPAAQP
jgi:4-amino-4-deoxy-L-arabinose transferase-like glycosyltransferase